MCVAIWKPRGQCAPALELLKRCWDVNADGAGFARIAGSGRYAIEFRKGFMNWADFAAAYEKEQLAEFGDDLFFHFRRATVGGVAAESTQPFCVSRVAARLKGLRGQSNCVLMHNGDLPFAPEVTEGSDTMELCRRMAEANVHRNIPALFHLLRGMVGDSKIAVMTRGGVYRLGEWRQLGGVFFSNTDWR